MIKSNNKIKKSMKNRLFAGFNILIIVSIFFMCAGCMDQNLNDITGTYSKDDKTVLELYDNNTYFFKLRIGYIAGREVNQTVTGTYQIEDDKVLFYGDGKQTVGYIQSDSIMIEGSKYTKYQ